MVSPSTHKTGISLALGLEQLNAIADSRGTDGLRLVIRKFNPGAMTGHQTTEVHGIFAGFDHEQGRVIFEPAQPLTELSPDEVAAIMKSVREGHSWHAYERDRKTRERITALEAEVADLKVQLGK